MLTLVQAMHRRITAAFEIMPPDHIGRRKIWEIHTQKTPSSAVKTDAEIDWDAISLKYPEQLMHHICANDEWLVRYELTGGFIKNAMLSALMSAVARNADKPLITEQDIVQVYEAVPVLNYVCATRDASSRCEAPCR